MSDLLKTGLNEYIDSLLPPADRVVIEMETYARHKKFPIIDRQAGRFLFQIARIKQPRRIFEMGSGFGYSAYWFCKGAPEAQIVLTDGNPAHLEMARQWLKQAGCVQQVRPMQGDAIELLSGTDEKFDIIFMDIDKDQYPSALPVILNKLNSGALLISDNLLWYGQVADNRFQDDDTAGVRKYNELLFQSDQLMTTVLPVRDGIGLSIKL